MRLGLHVQPFSFIYGFRHAEILVTKGHPFARNGLLCIMATDTLIVHVANVDVISLDYNARALRVCDVFNATFIVWQLPA